MKAVFISHNQALTEVVTYILDKQMIRGFTKWETVHGRGSKKGEPHYGSHTWPALNTAVMAIVDDHKVDPLLEALREVDKQAEEQGLRAFVWNIEGML